MTIAMPVAAQAATVPEAPAVYPAGPAPYPASAPGTTSIGAAPAGEQTPASDSPFVWSAAGRLRDATVSSSDRAWSVAMHLCPFAVIVGIWPALGGPLVLWLIRRGQSVFNDDHGREQINFSISFVLLHIVLLCTLVGVVLWPVLWIVSLVSIVRASVAAGNGEYFRYPLTWRFLS